MKYRTTIKNLLGICLLIALCMGRSTATAQTKGQWIKIFDGKTLTGWKGYNRPSVPDAWTIENGALKINKKDQNAGLFMERGEILYEKKFKNFELRLEYKVDKGANGGIFYLVRELPGKAIYHGAPEFQVLDNANHPDAKKGTNGNRKAGSLYDMIAANPQVSKPFGKWNKVRIVVRDGHVEHYLNGRKVVEYELWTENWEALVSKSKFKQWPEFMNPGGDSHSGYIGFQDHSDNVWYKNIKIKEL